MSRSTVCLAGFISFIMLLSFVPTVWGSQLYKNRQFVLPLANDWSFEQGQGGWTSNNGGYTASGHAMDGSNSWYTSGGGEYFLSYDLALATLDAVAGQTILFAVWYYPDSVGGDGSSNQARAEITYNYYTCTNICPLSPQTGNLAPASDTVSPLTLTYHTVTAAGFWVAPTSGRWYNVWVTATLPGDDIYHGRVWLNWVTVKIHGHPDFKAYVDLATLQIVDSAPNTATCGSMSVGYAVYQWQQNPDGTGFVDARISVYGERSSSSSCVNYYVSRLKLQVEMLPNDGTTTTQQGVMHIIYAGEGNDKSDVDNPAQNQQQINGIIETADFAANAVVGVAGGYVIGSLVEWNLPGAIIGTVVGGVAGKAIRDYLQQYATSITVYHPDANGGRDYKVWEQWDHSGFVVDLPSDDVFIRSAQAYYKLQWNFQLNSESSFQVKITASVNWGQDLDHCIDDPFTGIRYCYLDDAGWTQSSLILSVGS